jgi:hypothetical protein
MHYLHHINFQFSTHNRIDQNYKSIVHMLIALSSDGICEFLFTSGHQNHKRICWLLHIIRFPNIHSNRRSYLSFRSNAFSEMFNHFHWQQLICFLVSQRVFNSLDILLFIPKEMLCISQNFWFEEIKDNSLQHDTIPLTR